MEDISVRVDERGPARIRMRLRDQGGGEQELARDSAELIAAEEAAWAELLRRGRRLPAGSVEVVVRADEWGRAPSPRAVGQAIVRAAA